MMNPVIGMRVRLFTLCCIAVILTLAITANRAEAAGSANLVLNPEQDPYPHIEATYECDCDNSIWNVVNGLYHYGSDGIERDRWTNWPRQDSETITIKFGSEQLFNRVNLYVFNEYEINGDKQDVQTPSSFNIQYSYDEVNWMDVQNVIKSPETPEAATNQEVLSQTKTYMDTLNRADFDPIASPYMRIQLEPGVTTDVYGNVQRRYSMGLVELEVYFHYTEDDEIAAADVMGMIGQLPIQAPITWADQTTIESARSAYELLTATQKALVDNLNVLIAAEVQLNQLNLLAANEVITLIDVLPLPNYNIRLSDRSAVQAARAAYDALTEAQRGMVTNIGLLTSAESRITYLENMLSELTFESAFSNAAGDAISIRFTAALGYEYNLDALDFLILIDGQHADIADYIEYVDWDDDGFTIRLMLQSTEWVNASSMELSLWIGEPIPVITFKQLDVTNDHTISIDDIVQLISRPDTQIDVNRDGVFDRADIRSLLQRISTAGTNP